MDSVATKPKTLTQILREIRTIPLHTFLIIDVLATHDPKTSLVRLRSLEGHYELSTEVPHEKLDVVYGFVNNYCIRKGLIVDKIDAILEYHAKET